jgi:hypothetical protein
MHTCNNYRWTGRWVLHDNNTTEVEAMVENFGGALPSCCGGADGRGKGAAARV